MSNLLNNKSPRKKLLERGPQITPSNQFKLDETTPDQVVSQEARNNERKKALQAEKKITTVRVKRSTQHKLNALVSINKAETVDELIEIMIDEYMSNNITKEEKRQFDMVIDLYKIKEK